MRVEGAAVEVPNGEPLYRTSDVARELDCTPDAVQWLRRRGKLRAALRTVSGQYLYLRADVEQVKAERAAARDARRAERNAVA
jgi:hypothetical protein